MKAFFLAAFVVGACIASAANTALGADKDELQGEWVATSAEINGKPVPAKELKGIRFWFKGDTLFMWNEKNDENEKWDQGSYKTDSQKSPMQLNITIKKKTLHGIYMLKGDELKVCYEMGEKPENRPTKFATSKEKEEALIVFKRQKP
jgi:uncharacterized protein (TIGR03067 family)